MAFAPVSKTGDRKVVRVRLPPLVPNLFMNDDFVFAKRSVLRSHVCKILKSKEKENILIDVDDVAIDKLSDIEKAMQQNIGIAKEDPISGTIYMRDFVIAKRSIIQHRVCQILKARKKMEKNPNIIWFDADKFRTVLNGREMHRTMLRSDNPEAFCFGVFNTNNGMNYVIGIEDFEE